MAGHRGPSLSLVPSIVLMNKGSTSIGYFSWDTLTVAHIGLYRDGA